MNKLTLLFGIALCMVAVNARHFAEDRSEVQSPENDDEIRKGHSQPRHRRRRWQMNYGYDYPPPMYTDRRDFRNDQEVIQNIYRLLDEISATLRRQTPPPPPQPIYIPYPVLYPVPQTTCNTLGQKQPNITTRFPAMEDTNQNWGFVPEEEPEDDNGDGSRPISFDPIVPKQFMKRPAPAVEHGSQQASFPDQSPSLSLSAFSSASPQSSGNAAPGMCNAAILSCCFSSDKVQQKHCFTNIGCGASFNNGIACSPESVQKALESFRTAYSPQN